ncbi:MAG: hypothetical protein MRZ79_27020 [Bacteroidia bacterium]|nr:hypothetical protein [Bacteroidia bacterium]
MKKIILSLILGFIANNMVGTLVAKFVLNPLLNPMFGETIRSEEAGLEFPALLGGYLVLTFLMIVIYRNLQLEGNWMKKGLLFGLWAGGIIFLSGHLIVAGWSILPPLPMLLSGILDIPSTVATAMVIAYIYRNESRRTAH